MEDLTATADLAETNRTRHLTTRTNTDTLARNPSLNY